MSQNDPVLYASQGLVAEITLNRPDKLNAITADMVPLLHDAMDQAEADPKVRAIVLRGAGRSFSAGFDLGELDASPSREEMCKVLAEDFAVIMRFWNAPKPTLSLVQGYALGGGFELAMACDVTLAADTAIFGEPEPKFGSGIVALLLPWLTGPKQAKEMLLFGNDRVPAHRAYEMGLINRVLPEAELAQAGQDMAMQAALLDATALRLTKTAINQTYRHMGFDPAMAQALDLDLEIETSQSAESQAFKTILARDGVKAALAWRAAKLAAAPVPDAIS